MSFLIPAAAWDTLQVGSDTQIPFPQQNPRASDGFPLHPPS